MITDHPYLFLVAFIFFWATLGAWIGYSMARGHIGCLERRIDLLKMEIDRLAPGRGRFLR